MKEKGLRRTLQERKRSTTDITCLITYGILLIVWISIAIYAYCYSNISPFKMIEWAIQPIWEGFRYNLKPFFFSWICVLFITFYFIMLRWCTKFTVYFTLFLKFLFMSLPLIALTLEVQPTIVVPVLCFSYIIFWIEIQILRKVAIDTICKIIVDACRVSIAFPSSLLIVFLFIFTTALISIFIGTVIRCLSSFSPVIIEYYVSSYSDSYYPLSSKTILPVSNTGLIVTFLLCSIWILLANYLSMQSVLHGMFTSWCRMPSKGLISNFNIALYYLVLIYRYHIGTIAYMSAPIASIVHIIRIIIANKRQLQMKLKESRYNIYCFFVIIIGSITNTSVVSASSGKCFDISIKDAFQVIIQKPMKYTAIRLITTWIILFGFILIPSTVIGLSVLFCNLIFSIIVGTIAIIITSGVLFIFSTAVDSVLFCYLEDLSNKSKSRVENVLET